MDRIINWKPAWPLLLACLQCAQFDAQPGYYGFFLLNSGGGAGGGSASAEWWNSGWASRRQITIDNSSSPSALTNIPVLVSLSSANIDYSKTQDAGEDLRFLDADNTTVLSHEIELWNEAGTSVVWVNIPRVDAGSSSDSFYMYYDNASAADGQAATGVWDANYQMVLHLNETMVDEATGGAQADSTANGNAGSQQGNASVTGNTAGGQDFDGTDDYIATTYASNNLTTSLTISAYFYSDDAGSIGDSFVTQRLVTQFRSAGSSRLSMGINNDHIASYWHDGGNNVGEGTTALTAATWYHAVMTYDGATLELYLNGNNEASLAEGSMTAPSADTIRFAHQTGSTRQFDGRLDELRVSNSVRGADWILAQYKSQSNTYLTFGGEESN